VRFLHVLSRVCLHIFAFIGASAKSNSCSRIGAHLQTVWRVKQSWGWFEASRMRSIDRSYCFVDPKLKVPIGEAVNGTGLPHSPACWLWPVIYAPASDCLRSTHFDGVSCLNRLMNQESLLNRPDSIHQVRPLPQSGTFYQQNAVECRGGSIALFVQPITLFGD